MLLCLLWCILCHNDHYHTTIDILKWLCLLSNITPLCVVSGLQCGCQVGLALWNNLRRTSVISQNEGNGTCFPYQWLLETMIKLTASNLSATWSVIMSLHINNGKMSKNLIIPGNKKQGGWLTEQNPIINKTNLLEFSTIHVVVSYSQSIMAINMLRVLHPVSKKLQH